MRPIFPDLRLNYYFSYSLIQPVRRTGNGAAGVYHKVGFNRFLCRLGSMFWGFEPSWHKNIEKSHRNFSFSKNYVFMFYVLIDDDDDDVDVTRGLSAADFDKN